MEDADDGWFCCAVVGLQLLQYHQLTVVNLLDYTLVHRLRFACGDWRQKDQLNGLKSLDFGMGRAIVHNHCDFPLLMMQFSVRWLQPVVKQLWCYPGFPFWIILSWQSFYILKTTWVFCFPYDVERHLFSAWHIGADENSKSVLMHFPPWQSEPLKSKFLSGSRRKYKPVSSALKMSFGLNSQRSFFSSVANSVISLLCTSTDLDSPHTFLKAIP